VPTKAATTAELRRIAVCVDEPETACFGRVPIEQEGIDHRLKFVVAKPAARLPRMLCTIAPRTTVSIKRPGPGSRSLRWRSDSPGDRETVPGQHRLGRGHSDCRVCIHLQT
jgi:hypothetical protein